MGCGDSKQQAYAPKAAAQSAAGTLLSPEVATVAKDAVAPASITKAEAEAWIKDTLQAHNDLRAKHGSPPLVWDNECAEKAQLAADACGEENKLFHSHCQEYGHGQNAFGGTPGQFGAKDAIESWYSEFRDPGYKSPGAEGTGHFTQVVWLATTHVGMARDTQGKGFIVANYKPAGNMQPADPHYIRNVLPLGTSMQTRPKTCIIPKKVSATSLTDEVEAILNSIPQDNIKDKVEEHLKGGGKVDLDFKPPPGGEINVTFHTDRGSSSMMGGF
jgi:uncharacterized protein YkwD